jgi:hypothetical protein
LFYDNGADKTAYSNAVLLYCKSKKLIKKGGLQKPNIPTKNRILEYTEPKEKEMKEREIRCEFIKKIT